MGLTDDEHLNLLQKGIDLSNRSSLPNNISYSGDASSYPYPGFDSYSKDSSKRTTVMKWLQSAVRGRDPEETTWRTYTSITFFILFSLFSGVFFFISLFTLPLIMFAPYKFGLFLTAGTVCLLVAFAFLKSFDGLMEHMMSTSRMPFTIALFSSLLSTLIFTLIKPLYILGLLSSIVEVIVLFSFIGSFIPGGGTALKSMYSTAWASINGMIFRGRDQDMLPF